MSDEPIPPLIPPTPESVAENIQKELKAEGLGPDNSQLKEFYEGIGWKKKPEVPPAANKGHTDMPLPNGSTTMDEDNEVLDLRIDREPLDGKLPEVPPVHEPVIVEDPAAPAPAEGRVLEEVVDETAPTSVSQTKSSWKDYALGCLGLPLRPFRWAYNGISSWRARRAQERADRAAGRIVEPASSRVVAPAPGPASESVRPNRLYRALSWCWEHKKAVAGTVGAAALAIGTAYLVMRPSKPYQASLMFNKREWTLETMDYEKLPDEKRINKFIESYNSRTIDQKLLEADKADGVQDYKITKGIGMLK